MQTDGKQQSPTAISQIGQDSISVNVVSPDGFDKMKVRKEKKI